MPSHPVFELALEIVDLPIPVTRVVEIDASTRLERLHELIQIAFAWSNQTRHVFTDRRTDVSSSGWRDRSYFAFERQRVWEMDHGCRDRDHVSECGWTSTIADAFAAIAPDSMNTSPTIFYEYGVEAGCRAREFGEPCIGSSTGSCPGHGWTVAVSLLDSRSARRPPLTPRVLQATGRAPLEEACSATGYIGLLEVLGHAGHPEHDELTAWVRTVVGPWAQPGSMLDPASCDAAAMQCAIDDEFGGGDLDGAHGRVRALTRYSPRRFRIDMHAAIRRLDPLAPDDTFAERVTEPLRSTLRAVALATPVAGPGAGDSAVMSTGDPVGTPFARALGLVRRRNGVLLLTRAGEAAIDRPSDLLERCAAHYWKVGDDPMIGLFVSIAAAQGLADEALDRWVAAVCQAEERAPRTSSDDEWGWRATTSSPWRTLVDGRLDLGRLTHPYRSYLEEFGLGPDETASHTIEDVRAFAGLVLAR